MKVKCPEGITEKQNKLIHKAGKFIARKGMATASIFFLESIKPLASLGSQVLEYAEFFFTNFIKEDYYKSIVILLKDKVGISYMVSILEEEEYLRLKRRDKFNSTLCNIKKMKKQAGLNKKNLNNFLEIINHNK